MHHGGANQDTTLTALRPLKMLPGMGPTPVSCRPSLGTQGGDGTCSLLLRCGPVTTLIEGGSGCVVGVERWSLGKAQRTRLKEAEPHVNSDAKPSAHVLLSHQGSLPKYKFKDRNY